MMIDTMLLPVEISWMPLLESHNIVSQVMSCSFTIRVTEDAWKIPVVSSILDEMKGGANRSMYVFCGYMLFDE